jgi:DNA-binding response OmpR family regulator
LESTKDRIIVVDDDPILCEVLAFSLAPHFEVNIFNSGEQCLQDINDYQPKLVILDIDMPGISGYETCRKLRETYATLPVIFLSSCDTLEERLEAFDAGGDDFLTKPTDTEIIVRKVKVAIKHQEDLDRTIHEKKSYEQMAMTLLDNIGETGVLLNYTRANFYCQDYVTLATRTLEAAEHFGLKCQIQLRYPGGSISCNHNGIASPLEESVLNKMTAMGRLFQFKKRLVANFQHVTLIILNMPDNPDTAGHIKDNIATLAEIADEFVKTITIRNESEENVELIRKANLSAGPSVEILRKKYRTQQADTRLLLNDLISDVEKTFIHLGLTDSQEHKVSDVLHANSDKILHLFEQSSEFEKQFSMILTALTPTVKMIDPK